MTDEERLNEDEMIPIGLKCGCAMKKRIRKKLEKKNERLFGHIAVLGKYHCESCNMDFKMVGNKNIHIAKWFTPKCPICKNELKNLNNDRQKNQRTCRKDKKGKVLQTVLRGTQLMFRLMPD